MQDNIHITYYTDPLCCWSWAMEPSLQRLRAEYGATLHWQYRMGGLIPDWTSFADQASSISRPIQMGPVWRHAAIAGGVAIDDKLWFRDPPASSYPACIAVKCVELQDASLTGPFLRLLWQHCLQNGHNIAKTEELLAAANSFQSAFPGFDPDRFIADLKNGNGIDAFRMDLVEAKARNILRFPSLIIRKEGEDPILIQGFRTYEKLAAALANDKMRAENAA